MVLLAEDDEELRRLLGTMLARRGCTVLEARNGMELAQLIIERGVDPPPAGELVISDVRMPGVTGLEIAGLVRQVDWMLPVILMTAFGDEATHAEASRLGIVMFDKPVDLDVLVDVACVCLGMPPTT
ncbi:MAG TPA: response regulator [Kofleriaceae bacterium]|nr:response regulator [Kofleriaceae bacterium]